MRLQISWLQILYLAATLSGVFVSPAAFACSAVAGVTQTAQLKWPTLTIPATSDTYTIVGTGAGMTVSGTGTIVYGTAAVRGGYTIKRASGSNTSGAGGSCPNITINITGVTPGNANLTLTNFTGRYNNANLTGNPPWTGLALPTPGGLALILGATATYTSAIPAGGLTPTFNIVVTYINGGTTTAAQTAAASFDSPLSTDTVQNINFGIVKAATAGVYVINTTNNITPSGGGEWLGGASVSGSMRILGSASQPITISTGSYVVNNGVTPSAATCAYNGGAAAACDGGIAGVAPSQAGKTLLLGVTATVAAGGRPAGTAAAPTFSVTVVYQ